ncbi:MAG: methionyl-tRNA formyltransferase [Gammaproteobacteria bacterium RIFCSPHIGHO2_12_FULL_38_11]|nr:MAG: methionyl-tRNA formyltransferase [Gammaproteobacteria bacterium RIFCSPHIGHO2_12_FULL_38_11]
MSLKIIFAGTPKFAVPTLQLLIHSEHCLLAVYTQPDRPAGRGQHLHASPVKLISQENNIPVFQPKTLRDVEVQAELKKLNPDVIVVVAYGLILPQAVLDIPKYGCINVHPSLLPRWRGAAPIPRAIEAGDKETAVTIMQMDKGMDTGPILKQEKQALKGDETSEQLHDLFSKMGAQLLLKTLDELNTIMPIKQDNVLATHAAKIEKSEAVIDWNQSAIEINNKIRAFNSWPVASTVFNNQILKIWEAKVISEKVTAKPGEFIQISKERFCIATGDGVLEVLSVQLPGKKRMSAKDFLHGHAANIFLKTRG